MGIFDRTDECDRIVHTFIKISPLSALAVQPARTGRKSRDSAHQQDNGQQGAQKTLQVLLHGSLSSFFIYLGGTILSHRREDCKGTRRAVQMIVGLFVTGDVYLVEHNLLNREQIDSGGVFSRGSVYDFTLLIAQEPDELLLSRLRFLIDQFKPLRSRANIIFLGSQGTLDDYSYLDLNSMLLQPAAYALDDGHALFGMVRLEE